MATPVDTLLVRIETDMKGVRQDLKRLEQRTKQSTDKMNKSFSGMGKVFKLAVAAVIVREVARATGALIKLASDAEEMQAKSSVVFGAYTDDIRLFAKNLANDVGRSALELESMAATVQDTFVPMGFSRQEGAELSKVLTQLAVDVGSFNNKADAEVMRAFQSALVGNHETMRQFGVVITEITLKNELLAMGIKGGTKAATEQQKVQARLNLIMAGTTDAQGDAARTANSFANRVKKLQGQLADLGARLGNTLIPVASAVVSAFSEIIDTIENVLLKLGIIAPTAAEAVTNALKADKEALEKATKELDELLKPKLSEKVIDKSDFGFDDNNSISESAKNDPRFLAQGAPSEVHVGPLGTVVARKRSGEANVQSNQIFALKERISLLHDSIEAVDRAAAAEEHLIEKQKLQAQAEEARIEAAKSAHKGMIARQLALQAIHSAEVRANKKEKEEQDKNKEEAVKAHDLRMRNLRVELTRIQDVQKSLESGEKLSQTDRENLMFEKLTAESSMHHLDKNFTTADKVNNAIRLAQEADMLVAIEMANEANAERNSLREKGIALTKENISAVQKIKNEQADLLKLKNAFAISEELYQKLMDKTIIQLRELEPMYKIITDGLKQVADTISDTFADALMKGKLSLDSLANLVKSTVAKMIAHVLKMQVLAPILSAFGMQDSTLKTLGFQASGGTMQPNRPYIVGERGPELFVPSGAGTLLNNMNTQNAMSGASTIVNQSINLSTGVAQTVHAEVLNLLPAIKEQTMMAVSDSKRRGGAFAKVMG
jgi:hypothetical protein